MRTDIQIKVHPYNKLLLIHQKEQPTDIGNNLDESQRYYADWKKLVSKSYTHALWLHFPGHSWKGTSAAMENKSMVAKSWGCRKTVYRGVAPGWFFRGWSHPASWLRRWWHKSMHILKLTGAMHQKKVIFTLRWFKKKEKLTLEKTKVIQEGKSCHSILLGCQ